METPAHQIEPIGFAGLTTLVSEIPIGPPPKAPPKPESRSPDPAPRPQTTQASSAPSRKSNSAFKSVAISIAVIAILGFIVIASDHKTPQYTGSPAPTPAPIPVATAEPKFASPAPYVPPKPPEMVEEIPDASNGYVERTLSRNQIYYCLAEKTRVNILRDRTGDTSQQQIDYFNERVREYNARCGSYKYFQRDMDAAKRQFDMNTNAITARYIASLSPPPAPKPLPPTASIVVTPPPVQLAPTPSPWTTVAPAITAPKPAALRTIAEAVPPFGQGHRHSREELYYCYAESVRLDGAKQSIDMTSDTQVEGLNNRQNDFNTRCTHFTSDPADRDAVKKQLAAKRAALKKQGVAIANSWR